MYLCRASFLTTLDLYKAYLRGRHIRENTRRTYTKGDRCLILSERSYCVFAPQGFVIKCFLIFIVDEVKNFVANNFFQLVCQSRTRSRASLVSHVLRFMQKWWDSYIEEFRGSKVVKGFCYKFIYGDCRVQGQRFCTRSETSLNYNELLFGKVSPRFFTVKLVCFIGFPGLSYPVLFTFPLHDIDRY